MQGGGIKLESNNYYELSIDPFFSEKSYIELFFFPNE